MSMARPSKRQKLQHSGSRSNPIYILDDKSDPEAGDVSSPGPEPDSLQHVLSILDNLNRDDHLSMLMAGVEIAETRLDAANTQLENYSTSFAAVQREIERAKQFCEIVNAGAEEHDTKVQAQNSSRGQTPSSQNEKDRRIARANSSLKQVEQLLLTQGRLCVYARQLYEAVGRWANALDNLSDLWESLWDIYDAMTKPGSSSAPAKTRKMWDNGYRLSLWQELVKIEADAQAAERRVHEIEGAIVEEACAYARSK